MLEACELRQKCRAHFLTLHFNLRKSHALIKSRVGKTINRILIRPSMHGSIRVKDRSIWIDVGIEIRSIVFPTLIIIDHEKEFKYKTSRID